MDHEDHFKLHIFPFFRLIEFEIRKIPTSLDYETDIFDSCSSAVLEPRMTMDKENTYRFLTIPIESLKHP